MSQENVDKLRQGLDAFFRRDRQAWLALCDPNFESVPSDDWPEMEPIRGAEAAWDFYVETDRRFTEALVRGDYAAAATELGPKVEIDDTDIPESTGTDSFYAWLARWDEAWESWRIEDLEVRAVGGDRTISLFKMIARGKG